MVRRKCTDSEQQLWFWWFGDNESDLLFLWIYWRAISIVLEKIATV